MVSALTRSRGRLPLLVGIGLVLLAVAAAVGIAVYRARSVDVADSYEDIREQFKYGSIGSDSVNGIPYWIWLVLPTVFPEYLPDRPGDGYARMGFLDEPESPAHQRPIGISYRNYQSIPRIGVNCGACHTGVYRESVGSPATIVLGMPAEQMDLQSFFVFLFKAARDARFESDVLLPAIHAVNPAFSWFDDLVYRFLVIPTTRDALRKRADQLSFAERLPREGPGRVDTFTSYKVHFGLPIEDVVGTADLPPL